MPSVQDFHHITDNHFTHLVAVLPVKEKEKSVFQRKKKEETIVGVHMQWNFNFKYNKQLVRSITVKVYEVIAS